MRLSADLSFLRKSDGRPGWKRIGTNQVSTFPGFCGVHDNELFEPIDNAPLAPNSQQVFLYAYRCLCREYFVKENAVNLMHRYASSRRAPGSAGELFSLSGIGHAIGYDNLKKHKESFDESLARQAYSDVKYVCFVSGDKWNIQLSGVLYPDHDFQGQFLQDIADLSSTPALITYFTAPVASGWAFVFAWHESSADICKRFLSSFAAHCSSGKRPADALIRMTFSCCENHAIRPSWWSSLAEEKKRSITDRAALMAHPTAPVPSDYLRSGLEGIADWDFERVYSVV